MNASPANKPLGIKFTPTGHVRFEGLEGVPTTDQAIYKLADAIIALDERLSLMETAARAPFDCSPTDPGLSHPCGCDPPTELRYCPTDNTTPRYPCDPISVPLTPTGEKALEELWACLKLIAQNNAPGQRFMALSTVAWAEVRRRAKAIFPNRTL